MTRRHPSGASSEVVSADPTDDSLENPTEPSSAHQETAHDGPPAPPAPPPAPHTPQPASGLPQSMLREVQALASLVATTLEQTKQQAEESLARLREAEEAHNATRDVLEEHAADLLQAREELREVTAALIRLIENQSRRHQQHPAGE